MAALNLYSWRRSAIFSIKPNARRMKIRLVHRFSRNYSVAEKGTIGEVLLFK
jgi:hypothetical protein